MPSTFEFKARCASIEAFRDKLVRNGAEPLGSKDQDDTVFLVPGSRAGLKLREQSPGLCQLISWERGGEKGPKGCRYMVAPVSDPAATRQVLSAALRVYGRVIKRREELHYKGVLIHLDSVMGLGDFIECEAPLEDMSQDRAREILDEITHVLGISPESMIDRSYVELMVGSKPSKTDSTQQRVGVLAESDAHAFRELRLRALRENPEAFAASFEEEAKTLDREHMVLYLR